ncbi:hypothetical protein N7E02_26880 [Aliirhizobium terrae]|uniref:hypothetical protein n=1 Tax=Terrirhizobium terrae TaxID=2926709 RepID=UPI002578D8CC|nr:hypothetical protein [Rhizobium sp. CC-CFT758]WJH40199.1 hypothetical protein N7E02_26880 [Rhizobium sp. CC-CFT758]
MTYIASSTQPYHGLLANAALRGNTNTSSKVPYAKATPEAAQARRVRAQLIQAAGSCYVLVDEAADRNVEWRVSAPLSHNAVVMREPLSRENQPRTSKSTFGQLILLRLQVQKRLLDLDAEARDETISINAESRSDILTFLLNASASKRPAIALLDNGNFRALWRNADGEQIGLQFKGLGEVNYVLVYNEETGTKRDYGSAQLGHLLEMIADANLLRLLQNGG